MTKFEEKNKTVRLLSYERETFCETKLTRHFSYSILLSLDDPSHPSTEDSSVRARESSGAVQRLL